MDKNIIDFFPKEIFSDFGREIAAAIAKAIQSGRSPQDILIEIEAAANGLKGAIQMIKEVIKKSIMNN